MKKLYLKNQAIVKAIRGSVVSFCRKIFYVMIISITGTGIALGYDDKNAGDKDNYFCASSTLSGKVYVKGNSYAPSGNGTKFNPYNRLSLVPQNSSASTWKTLVVLGSSVPLEGTLILKNCQDIIGLGVDPVNSIYGDKSILKGNSNTADVLTLTGNHKIKRIWIKDAGKRAIQFNGIKNVAIRDVLITNFNKGNNPQVEGSGTINSAMGGTTGYGGTLNIKDSRIDGGIGAGVDFYATSAAGDRIITVMNSTITNLVAPTIDSTPGDPLLGGAYGVRVNSDASGTLTVNLTKVNMSKFDYQPTLGTSLTRENHILSIDALGMVAPYQSTIVNANVTRSTFSDMSSFDGAIRVRHNSGNTTNLVVKKNTFNHTSGISTFNQANLSNNVIVKDNDFGDVRNLIRNPYGDITTLPVLNLVNFNFSGLPSTVSYDVSNNSLNSASAGFFFDFGIAIFDTTQVNLSRNRITNIGLEAGRAELQGTPGLNDNILVFDYTAPSAKRVKVEKNCFRHGGTGITHSEYFGPGDVIVDAGGGPLGSVGQNSFVDMQMYDVAQIQPNIFAKNNYWGGGSATLKTIIDPFTPVFIDGVVNPQNFSPFLTQDINACSKLDELLPDDDDNDYDRNWEED